MTEQQIGRRSEGYQLLAWSVFLPPLIVWPFLSAFPAFTLLGGSLSTVVIAVNIILLGTGFWALAAAWIAFRVLSTPAARGILRAGPSGGRGLWIGGYAAAWTTLYAIVALASR